ncbi:hypothetical protein BB561_001952 [Smittium simulii]|uniref:Uncharacterized protein n=1 Tax=Smittium simulii TaxID=133385 RepID=A0A2T9YSF8_9FUNG|nr:hypothetical protein BB561_001952 [Smittium simulii]
MNNFKKTITSLHTLRIHQRPLHTSNFNFQILKQKNNIPQNQSYTAIQALWKPIANIFLWSSVSFLGLKLIYLNLRCQKLEQIHSQNVEELAHLKNINSEQDIN